jgi:hypothetical protein
MSFRKKVGVYDQAELARLTRVYWHTHETNRIAMELYDKIAERSGFLVIGGISKRRGLRWTLSRDLKQREFIR